MNVFIKKALAKASVLFGADNRNRTCMREISLEPESSASASSATSAYSVVPVAWATHIIIADTYQIVKRFLQKSVTFCGLFKNIRCINKWDFKVFMLVLYSRTSIFSTKTFFQRFLSFVRQKKHKNNVATSKLLLFSVFYPCIMGTFAVLLCGRLPRAWHLLP